MTACVIITGTNYIETFTDGAAYDDDGVFGCYNNKVAILPHIPAVVFARGSGTACRYAKANLSIQPDFDAMVERMPAALHVALEKAVEHAGDAINLAVIAAGWSESSGEWQSWRCFVQDDGDGIFPGSYEVERLPSFYAEPWPNDEALTAVGLGSFDDFQWTGSVEDGVALMEAIRRTPLPLHPDSDAVGCLCGGFVQRTVVSHDGCMTGIVRRWPDRIGEKLAA